jgi:secreted trypsin-like serine protease
MHCVNKYWTEENSQMKSTRKHVIVAALVLVVSLSLVSVASAITWGEPDTEHTNVGAMMMVLPGWGNTPVCSGTLIHPRVFLTAGHCTDGVDPGEVWVNFNQDGTNLEGILDVAEVITHPDYRWGPTSNPHDVGVLILAEPVMDIEPANLPDEGFLDQMRKEGKLNQGKNKAKFTLVGYGATLDWPPPEITYEDQRQFSVSEYRALLKAWLRISQNQATGDGGTCYGDSGGPAFWTEPDGTEILVGITSWGDAPCVAAGFNYRVDIPDTLDFINEVVANLDQ